MKKIIVCERGTPVANNRYDRISSCVGDDDISLSVTCKQKLKHQMTYIVGWKYKGNIYLTSDSAITREVEKTSAAESSVGEKQVSTTNLSINEESFKLFQIDADCIIAISGDVANAVELVQQIRSYTTEGDRSQHLDKICKSSCGKKIDVIIGLIHEKKPRLFVFKSESTTYFQEKDNYVCLGSGVGQLALRTHRLIESISEIKLTPTKRLALLVSGHLLFSLNEDVYHKGVGGLFNGVRISKNGIQWNEDIAYVFYSKNTVYNHSTNEITGESTFVFTYNRDGMQYIKSPHPIPEGTDVLLPNCEDYPIDESSRKIIKWRDHYYDKLNDKIYRKKKKTKHISIIYKSNRDKYKVSLIKIDSNSMKSVYIKYDGEGWYSLYIHKDKLKPILVNDSDKDVECSIITE